MDEFFGNTTVEKVIENHAQDLSRLSESEIKRVLALYKTVRHDVRDRLDALSPGTFTAQKFSGVLAQVDAGIYQMNEILKGEMQKAGATASELGIEHLLEEIKKFEREFTGAVIPINVDAVLIASDSSNFLFNKYETSVSAYSAQLRSLFAQNLSQAAVEEISMGEVAGRIGRTLLGEEWRLNRLIRTEIMGVYSFGKLSGMREVAEKDLPDLRKTLYHPMDDRTGTDTKRLNENNPVVRVDEPFVENSTGKKVTYMAPPNRPNDRAILIPYREAWSS